MNTLTLSTQDKMVIMSKTGLRPGSKGKMLCPLCQEAQLHYEISARDGSIKASCESLNCVQWEE